MSGRDGTMDETMQRSAGPRRRSKAPLPKSIDLERTALLLDVDGLFRPLKLPCIGAHGAEMRLRPDGAVTKRHPPEISEAIRERLYALSALDPRLLVEDKLHSIAVHYRLALHHESFLEKEIAA